MALDDINVGSSPGDDSGESLRSGGVKINDNFDKVLEGPAGSVTDGGIVLFDGTGARATKGGQQPEQITAERAVAGSTTLQAGDAGGIVKCTAGSAVDVTVPPNTTVAYAPRTIITVYQYGAGTVTIQPGAGVTLRSVNSLRAIVGQFGAVTLYRIAADEWLLMGALG